MKPTTQWTKGELLANPIKHIDITKFDARPVVTSYREMAYTARTLARASDIYSQMLADKDCAVILTLAGSLVSAGLKKALMTLVEHNMVDAIVSTGANIVDQDFFEGLGFKHYMAPHLRHLHRRGRTPRVRRHHAEDLRRPPRRGLLLA